MTWRPAVLLFVTLGILFSIALLDPIPQDPAYHLFADQRAWANVPNFLNVMSNLPFLIIGVIGLQIVTNDEDNAGKASRLAWAIFFFGIALTALGSGYFHWQPNNVTLVWDRLPMTIGFMSLVSIIISEYFSARLGRVLLVPLLLLGISSVVYWAYTESQGSGDLRPYAAVQFLPMLLIPITIVLYPARSDLSRYIVWMVGFYVLAKLFEYFDFPVYALGDAISGHTLKHIAASLAPAVLLYGLLQRQKSR